MSPGVLSYLSLGCTPCLTMPLTMPNAPCQSPWVIIPRINGTYVFSSITMPLSGGQQRVGWSPGGLSAPMVKRVLRLLCFGLGGSNKSTVGVCVLDHNSVKVRQKHTTKNVRELVFSTEPPPPSPPPVVSKSNAAA